MLALETLPEEEVVTEVVAVVGEEVVREAEPVVPELLPDEDVDVEGNSVLDDIYFQG